MNVIVEKKEGEVRLRCQRCGWTAWFKMNLGLLNLTEDKAKQTIMMFNPHNPDFCKDHTKMAGFVRIDEGGESKNG